MPHLKPWLRDAAASLLFRAGLTTPRRAGEARLTIATFHRVLPPELLAAYPLPEIAVTPDELAWFVGFFARHFECGTLEAQHRSFAAETPSSKPRLAITFDDGQADNFRHAVPVLEAAGVRASFFVVASAIERDETLFHDRLAYAVERLTAQRPSEARSRAMEVGVPASVALSTLPHHVVIRVKVLPAPQRLEYLAAWEAAIGGAVRPPWDGMMSWTELRGLAERGHEVGSHSMSHAILPLCDDEELTREVDGSRRFIEERLGRPLSSFCYPNGDFDRRTARAVAASGYARAVTTRWGLNGETASPYELTRCDMQGQHARSAGGKLSTARLAWRMSGLHPGLG
jgi:peptidoglycan/xylan/chitin deacetylase (PgdA/CDA1 family)